MSSQIIKFCEIARNRSHQNSIAFSSLSMLGDSVRSPLMSILRQETDTMIRALYLVEINNVDKIEQLLKMTERGEKWAFYSNGKARPIRDADLVKIATKFEGWTKYVYDFGCAYIHLSNFHYTEDPITRLNKESVRAIKFYIEQYHGPCITKEFNIDCILYYLPDIFKKIHSHSLFYLDELESLFNK